MPNWCDNTLEVSHEDPKMITRLKEAFIAGRLCDEFIPIPAELRETTAPNRDEAKVVESLIEKYGAADWYDFCVNNWGTKWDVGGEYCYIDGDDKSVSMSFESAWSPPTGLYVKLEELGFNVRAMYYEPGMAFAGIYEDAYDETFNLEGTADEVEAEIPKELDEAFGITESMRDWEENDQ